MAQVTIPTTATEGVDLSDAAPLSRSRTRERLLGLLLFLPSLVVFGVFVFYPMARTVWLGFFETDFFGGNRSWVGFRQYGDVLGSSEFRNSLKVTILFALYTVPTGLALGVGLAVLAHKQLRGIGFFRTTFSSTVATSVAVASLMWLVLLNPSIGLLTQILPFEILKNPGLLRSPTWALLAVGLTTVWQNLGFTFLVMTAGLQSIPEELYESARIDGAGGWRQFTNVTLPLLSPTLLFGFVVLTINAFQSFGQIDLLTQGGPLERTNVIVYSIYRNAFGQNVDQGAAAAQAVVLFVIVLVLTVVQFRVLERRVHYGS
ncbi:MAG: sugar ABC transporter permease [Acidimicrobiales bacterium]|nr:sugar ABC transporter permease [Acidimicrobiales bacterium]